MCVICGNTSEIYRAQFHYRNSDPVTIKLCYLHDLELFKHGQRWFMDRYRKELRKLAAQQEGNEIAAPESATG